MAITNYDKIIEQLTNATSKSQDTWFFKNTLTADAVGAPTLMWRAAGFPGAGAVPATGAGTIPTKDTAGAIFLRNAAGGENSYLTGFEMGAATSHTWWLIDMLWFNSGLSGTVTTPQTFTSTALTRYGDTASVGNKIGLICWTATGSTATTVTVEYTDQDGNTAQVTPSVNFWTGAFGAGSVAPTADQMQILPLAASDTGVRALANVDLAASTLTAGNFGACIFRPLAMLSAPAGAYTIRDLVLQTPNLPEKLDDACLMLVCIPNSTTIGLSYGMVRVVEG